MRVVGACMLSLMVGAFGCARVELHAQANYPDVLRSAPDVSARGQVHRPTGACLQAAEDYAGKGNLMPEPLDPLLRAQIDNVIHGLHPAAKQVLRRTEAVWFARHLDESAAVFLPCSFDERERTGGVIIVDITEFPLSSTVQDSDVPRLYWGTLGSLAGIDPDGIPRPGDEGIRYILLHELGHALSLYTDEFVLDERQRMQVSPRSSFVGLSWKSVVAGPGELPQTQSGEVVQAWVPKTGLNTRDWGNVLERIGGNPALLVPGYATAGNAPHAHRDSELCGLVEKLPDAGFVTPTAARYPTEDFAEVFAHAILANEGKIFPSDRLGVAIASCQVTGISSPYFAPAMRAKRAYMEAALGIASVDLP